MPTPIEAVSPAAPEKQTTAAPGCSVSVRALCEFSARSGDLDLRFTPSTTALEGIAGHALVAARRGPGYRSELALQGRHGPLRVRGRADGYDPERRRLEEYKTFRGDLQAMPANRRALHRAQLLVYGALLCRELALDEVELALVYFDVATQNETPLLERHAAADLQAAFEERCDRYLAWAEQERAHRAARDAALEALRFAHADFRPGQRDLSEAVYRAAVQGRCLLAQAPTGIGKTVGTLYPMLKACPAQRLDKLFFLAAKTPGRALALRALDTLRAAATVTATAPTPMPLRVLELVARDKACEHPDKACHGESCPLAQGFYDRLPAARAQALALASMARAALREVALAHRVCPYYLAQDLVRWADVVVGDYNYYFDGNAMLHGMTVAGEWRVGLLVDEAHNLVARARAMYSAELASARLEALQPVAPPSVAPALARLLRCWAELERLHPESYAVLEELPAGLLTALHSLNGALAEHLADAPAGVDAALLAGYFELLQFARLCESFGDHSLLDLSLGEAKSEGSDGGSTLCLRNLVPAPFLKPRLAAAHTSSLFSATLSPQQFQRDLLGLPDDTAWIDVASPFEARQLQVRVVDTLSTRWRDRAASLSAVVELMARQYHDTPGNYLAFFSSFEYLHKAAAVLHRRHPDITVWEQSRGMAEAEREAFLAQFSPQGRGIGFAVLGGAFAEGIDLPGRRLIGAFITTLGLPQVNAVNQQMKARMQALFGAGHDYAYLVPGLQKVVQAAGRVIRSATDEGVLLLIDDRYAGAKVRGLLPPWWHLEMGAAAPARLPAQAH